MLRFTGRLAVFGSLLAMELTFQGREPALPGNQQAVMLFFWMVWTGHVRMCQLSFIEPEDATENLLLYVLIMFQVKEVSFDDVLACLPNT